MEDFPEPTPKGLSRRDVIKGVIAAGSVSSAGYLFRASAVHAQNSVPGSVERLKARLNFGRARRRRGTSSRPKRPSRRHLRL